MSNQNISEAAKKIRQLFGDAIDHHRPLPEDSDIQQIIDADRAARKPQEWSWRDIGHAIEVYTKESGKRIGLTDSKDEAESFCAAHNSTPVPQPPKEEKQCMACDEGWPFSNPVMHQIPGSLQTIRCQKLVNETPPISEQTTPSQTGLLPCPFCGNENPELVETHKNHWRVGCPKCGSYNNNSLGKDNAIKAWNKRATPTTREETPQGCKCQNCGKLFTEDVTVPNDVWEKIKPTGKPVGAGLLCGNCIVKRVLNTPQPPVVGASKEKEWAATIFELTNNYFSNKHSQDHERILTKIHSIAKVALS